MVTFHEPTAGMFIWMKVNGIDDTRKLVYEKAIGQEVLLLPGSVFFHDQSKTYPYIRVAYSLSTPEQIETVDCLVVALIDCADAFRAWRALAKFFARS